jgi:iron complex outermembrane receptor protein
LIVVIALGLALAGAFTGLARAQETYDLSIPGGDLASVVTGIARATGTPIAFPAGLATGRKAGPIKGRTSLRAALDQALAGTGLVAVSGAGGIWRRTVLQPSLRSASVH